MASRGSVRWSRDSSKVNSGSGECPAPRSSKTSSGILGSRCTPQRSTPTSPTVTRRSGALPRTSWTTRYTSATRGTLRGDRLRPARSHLRALLPGASGRRSSCRDQRRPPGHHVMARRHQRAGPTQTLKPGLSNLSSRGGSGWPKGYGGGCQPVLSCRSFGCSPSRRRSRACLMAGQSDAGWAWGQSWAFRRSSREFAGSVEGPLVGGEVCHAPSSLAAAAGRGRERRTAPLTRSEFWPSARSLRAGEGML